MRENQGPVIVSVLGIGSNVRKLREAIGLQQKDVIFKLAQMGIDVSPVRYSQIEHNKRNVRDIELVGLRAIFNCTFDDFFDGMTVESLNVRQLELERAEKQQRRNGNKRTNQG